LLSLTREMRALWLAVAVCGCSSTLDESGLLGRGDPPAGAGTDMAGGPGGQVPDLAPAAAPTSQCTDFSDTPVGTLPLGWADVRGTWRVAIEGGMRVLRQEAEQTGGGGGSEFMVSNGPSTQRNLQVTVLATSQGHHNDECVMLRYRSTSSYYALCLDSGPDDLYPTQWELVRKTNGGGGGGNGTVELAGGPLADLTRSTHLIGLKVIGNTLTPIVDSVARAPVTDDAIAEGAIGLMSESKGRFTQVCVTQL
jgi:hypothetical protein